MNSDDEAIRFYAASVFKYKDGAKMQFKSGIWPYLKFVLTEEERRTYANVAPAFIHNTTGYKRIYNLFHTQVKIIHGKKAIKFIRGRPVCLELEPVYEEGESEYVMPWKSDEFQTHRELLDQAIGFSKLAFVRILWPEILPSLPHLKLYNHTGVTLLRRDGEVDLVEVNKFGNVVRTKMTNMTELLNGETSRMFFDNTCLIRRGSLDTRKTLFRLARILGRSVNYNVTNLNCDHVATWVLVGRIAWTTAVFKVDANIQLPTFPGEIDGSVLLEIETQLNL